MIIGKSVIGGSELISCEYELTCVYVELLLLECDEVFYLEYCLSVFEHIMPHHYCLAISCTYRSG